MSIVLKWIKRGKTITQRGKLEEEEEYPTRITIRKFWTVKRTSKARIIIRTGPAWEFIDITRGQAKELIKQLEKI